MATTPKGIYFPEGKTFADFPQIFKNIAESVDNTLGDFTYDSGWILLTTANLTGNWESYNTTGSQTRYRKVGKRIMFDGIARKGTAATIYTMPSGFRPNVQPSFEVPVISTETTDRSVRAYVTVNGVLSVTQATQAERNSGIGLSGVKYYAD